jgi:glycosyltransferase involved in cell wall biosynthesis
MSLSVYIIASNEEKRIGRCLDSCKGIAGEIIVVHNNCTDRTVEIASSKGALCIEHKWTNYRDQKSFALSQCKGEWALNLDADEVLSDQLKISLKQFLYHRSLGCEGLSFDRRSFFLQRWIYHGDWYPDTITRMSRLGAGEWSGPPVHEFLKINGRTKKIKGDILHYSYEGINDLVKKSIHYTNLYVKSVDYDVSPPAPLLIFCRSIWRFLRCYFLKFGFMDGFPGLVIAINSAFYVFLKYAKLHTRFI